MVRWPGGLTGRRSSPARQPGSLYCSTWKKYARIAFIDTAPAVESPALAAVRAADFCLIVSEARHP